MSNSGVGAVLSEWTGLAVLTGTCREIGCAPAGNWWQYYCLPLATSTLVIVAMALRGLYSLAFIADFRAYWRGLSANFALIGLAGTITAMMTMQPTRTNADAFLLAALWFGFAFLMCCGSRWLISRQFQAGIDQGATTRRAAVIGCQSIAGRFLNWVKCNRFGVELTAQFLSAAPAAGVCSEAEVQGWLKQFLEYQKSHDIDIVVLALPELASHAAQSLVAKLQLQPVTLLAVPTETIEAHPTVQFTAVRGVPQLALIELGQPPVRLAGGLAKSIFDRLAALMALLIFSPIMLACAIGIKLTSPGPVLFRQPRIGYRNREFKVLKFRTMHVTIDPNVKLTERNDSRVFKFGSILRKLSFDELPQLINVLTGDMSLVGPRPHMPQATANGKLYHEAVIDYELRHGVKPGITGWAQVNGWRGPTETIRQIEQRVDHDFQYIRRWSLWFDIVILIKTVFVGFGGENAF